MRLLTPLAVATFVATASAQLSVVIPNGFANVEGNTSNAFPWGRTGIGLFHQCVYDSSHFTLQGITTPILITGLKWRPDTNVALVASSYTVGCTVKLSTCPVDQAAVSTVTTANEGADLTTCYSGVVSWGAQAAQAGPTPFGISVQFSSGFVYDPTLGDLNIECDLPVQIFTGQGPQLDVVSTTGVANASRIYMSTGYPTGPVTVDNNHAVVVEVDYVSAGGGTIATNTTIGAGCGGTSIGNGSLYELFDGVTNNFDLSNKSINYVWTGSGYAVLPLGTNPIVPPTGGGLTLGDDQIVTLPLPFVFPCPGGDVTSIDLCSNGFLGFQPGLPSNYTESVTEFLSLQSRLAFFWDDLNPSTGGTVTAQAVGSDFVITFTNVPEFSTTDQNSAQVVLSPNGSIEVRYGTVALLDALVGITSGNGATDPGSLNLSAAGSLPVVITTGQSVLALNLTALSRPVLGTNWNLTTNHIPAPGITLSIFGLVDPGITDLVFLGAPGCQLHSTLDYIAGPDIGFPSAPHPFAVPNVPGLIGIDVFATSTSLAPGVNSLGFITSNTIKGSLGDI